MLLEINDVADADVMYPKMITKGSKKGIQALSSNYFTSHMWRLSIEFSEDAEV